MYPAALIHGRQLEFKWSCTQVPASEGSYRVPLEVNVVKESADGEGNHRLKGTSKLMRVAAEKASSRRQQRLHLIMTEPFARLWSGDRRGNLRTRAVRAGQIVIKANENAESHLI